MKLFAWMNPKMWIRLCSRALEVSKEIGDQKGNKGSEGP